jgi:hypothetical protein
MYILGGPPSMPVLLESGHGLCAGFSAVNVMCFGFWEIRLQDLIEIFFVKGTNV